MATSIGAYINAQTVFLLRDKTHFDLDSDYQGRVTSNILLVAIIAGILFSLTAGCIYDFFGRKLPIFVAILGSAVFIALCPYTAPSLAWLATDRSIIQICVTVMMCHPLTMDYVK